MRALLLLIFLACLVALSSCENTWSQEDKDNYTHTCMESLDNVDSVKAKNYCSCMLGKLTTKYPNVNDMLEHMQDVVNDPEFQQCKENIK